MLEQIKFVNHMGETIKFGENSIFVNYNDLHDYMWSYQSENEKISLFKRGIVNKTIPLIICCNSVDEGLQIKNQLMEIAEKDILAKETGRLVIGEYYLNCYIIGSTKKNYLIKKGYIEVELKLLTDSPFWVKEFKKSFTPDGSGAEEGRNFDFPTDYAMDFTSSLRNNQLDNPGFADSDFELRIYGACANPVLYIGGHAYQMNLSLESNEYVTINSKKKTIIKTNNIGTESSVFKYRERSSYIFEKIPSGVNDVVWADSFAFDITLYEERSEPKWI